jgi:hypothetical protein
VAGVVAQHGQGFGAVAEQQLEAAALVERAVEIAELAVQLGQHGALGQRRRDGGGDRAAGHAGSKLRTAPSGN